MLAVLAYSDSDPALLPPLRTYAQQRAGEFGEIPDERKAQLQQVADYVRAQVDAGQTARLTFICTHNSRRSHLAQVWAHTAAAYYGVPHVATFSGGTEATAFNPRAVAALKRAGFDIPDPEAAPNPRYRVAYSERAEPLECFSKVYTDAPNPAGEFCAVMTCSDADENCPMVAGAVARFAIPYEDPKAFDGTPQEAEKYDERCRQIAREMLYLMSRVSSKKATGN